MPTRAEGMVTYILARLGDKKKPLINLAMNACMRKTNKSCYNTDSEELVWPSSYAEPLAFF